MKQKPSISLKFIRPITLFMGLGLFLWSIKVSIENQKVKVSLDVNKQLNYYVSNIHDDLTSSTELLFSLSNLLHAFENLTANEFKKFTHDLSVRKRAILLVEWQPRVLETERDSFLRNVRENLGIKSYQMVEPDANNVLIEAKNRPEHFPVLYSVSTKGLEESVGLDLSWSPERMISKYNARDTGELRASNSFEVVLTKGSTNLTPGFAITLPVYSTNETPVSIEKRRENLRGFLAAVVYLDELISPLNREMKSRGLEVQITDLGGDSLISKSTSFDNSGSSQRKIMSIFGQEWEVIMIPTDKYLSTYFTVGHFFVPFMILLFFVALFVFLQKLEATNKELRNTQTHLREALRKSKVAAKSKMLFLANMSHEIRTPMNAILGYVALMKDEISESRRSQYIERVSKSGSHLLNIIDDILEISSLEDSRIKMRPGTFDLTELVEEVNDIVMPKKTSNNVNYKYHVDSSLGELYGDSIRLKQILVNLLSNSFKFTNEGNIELGCHRKKQEGDTVLVEFVIQDTGAGMDEKYLPDAFQAFTQEDVSFRRTKGGVGLGLSIIYSLVKMMNGSINVETEKDVGTTFFVELPFGKKVNPTDENDSNREIGNKKISFDSKKLILVAEDDQDARFLIEEFLKNENLQLDFAVNGHDLISKNSEKTYDLILTDLQMPELDGVSAIKRLRKDGFTTPILALSAHVLLEEKENVMLAGANGILSKPFDRESLTTFVSQFLN